MPLDSEYIEASFSLCLQLTQVPRSPDLVIFVSMTTTTTTRPITLSLVHACGVKMKKGALCWGQLHSNHIRPGQTWNCTIMLDLQDPGVQQGKLYNPVIARLT